MASGGNERVALMRRGLRRWTVLALVAGAVSLTSGALAAEKNGVSPQVISLPSGPGSIEGLGSSFEPQLSTGTAAYSVELAVPPGVNKHQPSLTLQYSSGLGNGHFGIGWTLSSPSISRQTDKGQPAYGATDVFVYSNGEELVPLEDGTWRCENEGDFMRFRPLGDGWEIRDRSGRIYTLGQHLQTGGRVSRVKNSDITRGVTFDETYRWYVDSFVDTNGNRVEYFYDQRPESPGELYLSQIRYNEIGSAFNAVDFVYEERVDAFSDYRPGFKIVTGRRGTRVAMRSQGELVREYTFDYESARDEILDPTAPGAVSSQISLLTKVTQHDNQPGDDHFLPPLRFGYTRLHFADQDNPGNTFPGPEDVDLNGNGIPDGVGVRSIADAPLAAAAHVLEGSAQFLDVNGDGLPDLVDTSTPQHVYYENLGGDRYGPQQTMGGPVNGVQLLSPSATLADLDGDGLADLVNQPTPGSLTVFRNRGNGAWGPGVGTTQPPIFGLTGTGVQLLDINFDKVTDVVRSLDGDTWQVCIRDEEIDIDHPPFDNFPSPEDVDRGTQGVFDGGSWDCGNFDMPFVAPVQLTNSSVRLADMNGDRLLDVVWLRQFGVSTRVVWFYPNIGGGRFDSHVVMAASGNGTGEITFTSPADDASLKLLDVNGDGLSDLVKVGPNRVDLVLNLGGDLWDTPQSIPGTPTFDPSNTSLQTADINANGSTDLIWIKVIGPVQERWQYLDFSPAATPNQLRLIDNGIGRRTEIGYRSTTDYMLEARDQASPPNPWTLVSATPVQVVSRVTTTPNLDLDGEPGTIDAYITDFSYRDAYYDPYEKEFRGFAFVKKIDRGDSTAPTQVTRVSFHTGAPDGVDNDGDEVLDERTALGGSEEEALKGRILRQEVTTEAAGADSPNGDGADAADSETFTRTASSWTIRQVHDLSGGSRGIATLQQRNVSFSFMEQEDVAIVERANGTRKDTQKRFAYDDFGNMTAERNDGVVGVPNDERFTFTEYITDANVWIVDRPCHKTVTGSDEVRVTETRLYYDGAPLAGLPLCTVGTRGNMSREEDWVAGSYYINKVRRQYDGFGNVITIMDPEGETDGSGGITSDGHYTQVQYDPVFSTFPVQETIHIGNGNPALFVNAEWDNAFGVMTLSTDFNDNETEYVYDAFGRIVKIVKPFDSPALPTALYRYTLSDPVRDELYDYDPNGSLTIIPFADAPSFVTSQAREEAGQAHTFDKFIYSDGLGRALATIEEGETNFIVTGAVLFNSRATARETFQPYTSLTSAWTAPSTANPSTLGRTSVRYDASGRETLRINPPESFGAGAAETSATTSYSPLVRLATDEEGKQFRYTNDALERLAKVEEFNLGQIYVTQYDYNPAGSLTRTTDDQGNVKLFVFDGLQRKVFTNDPDRGHMTYDYDDASNLRHTLDAKGQSIEYRYDGANRLIEEDYLDAGLPISFNRPVDVRYHYDTPVVLLDLGDSTEDTATHTKGQLAYVEDLSGEQHTSYDARGRVKWSVKRIPDSVTGQLVSYKSEMTYDSLDRVVSQAFPDGDQITHAYNNRSLLQSIVGGPSVDIIGNVDYRPSAQLERCDYGNGVSTNYTYDPRLRMVNLLTGKPASNPLLRYEYAFDGASNISRIGDLRPVAVAAAERRNTQIFEYDDLYRLTQVQYSFAAPLVPDQNNGVISYGYDHIGNMRSQISTLAHEEEGLPVANLGVMNYGDGSATGASNRIGRDPSDPPGPHALATIGQGASQRLYEYDDNGNMTVIDGMTLEWDFKDRLRFLGNAEMRAEYTYDHSDRRITKKIIPKGPGSPSSTSYPGHDFEIRENSAPVKYVFQGDTRVARITGTLDVDSLPVQRFSLYLQWNLITLAVQASDAADQLGIGVNPAITAAFRWNSATQAYDSLTGVSPVDAGSVVWIRTSAPITLQVRGSYADPSNVAILAGGSFLPVPGLMPLNLDESLPLEIQHAWFFDAENQIWRVRLTGALGALSDAPAAISPGNVIYLQSSAASQLTLPGVASRIQYYHQDHLGSSNVVADANGTLVEEVAFYPFGHPRNEFRPSALSKIEPYKFTQKELDAESRLQYFEARYLTGPLGRFVSVDPVLEDNQAEGAFSQPQRLNAYAYAINRPTVMTDSNGRAAWLRIGPPQLRPLSEIADYFGSKVSALETVKEAGEMFPERVMPKEGPMGARRAEVLTDSGNSHKAAGMILLLGMKKNLEEGFIARLMPTSTKNSISKGITNWITKSLDGRRTETKQIRSGAESLVEKGLDQVTGRLVNSPHSPTGSQGNGSSSESGSQNERLGGGTQNQSFEIDSTPPPKSSSREIFQ